ncbi:FAD-binding oxidoreductase [Methylosinus sp. Ce-a6]|uniref:FAD-binding oxidoreductase n=1 Tax=Methylosinus sp. Ce-a6 TaxID=2172005 RepID=UPI00135C8EDC|nr:FAD-binding oxidoreductase [Methylosinus sp. Ce-a6]
MTRRDDSGLLDRLSAIVGRSGVIVDPGAMAAYLHEPRDAFFGRALSVVEPRSAREVASILALCNDAGVGVVPQGGNTGLVGGQTPDESGAQIVLSLRKLDKIREVDSASDTMTVEAGVILANAQAAAEAVGRYFPLSLAAEGSCTIGGNLATNAGGVHVIAYGAARDLALGLEVALADGRLLSGLSKLRKDNTGYDLAHLFIGSEGTLGVITAATLKLFPLPRSRATAFVGLADPRAALALLSLAKARAGAALVAFELIPRIGVEFVLRHMSGVRDPLSGAHRWYVLIELASPAESGVEELLTELLGEALEQGVAEDAAVAATLEQRAGLWKLRETLPEAQKPEGGSIKHDVSVPLESIPAFLEEANALVTAHAPGARPTPFGHMGDGNIHYNVSQPECADRAAFLARREEINEIVHGLVTKYSGSVSAEHGVGALKRDLLRKVKDPVALELMRAIKSALDPKGILNPGKML